MKQNQGGTDSASDQGGDKETGERATLNRMLPFHTVDVLVA
jgi:hypothetical protein